MRLHQAKYLFYVILFFSLTLAAPSSLALEERFEVEADINFCTDYLWRGLIINDDYVLQPSLALAKSVGQSGLLFFNVWGNYDLTDAVVTKNAFSEIDFIASYILSLGPLRFETGVIHYTFPDTSNKATSEIFLSTSYELGKIPLTLNLSGYYDFDEIKGFYGSVKAESEISFLESLSLNLGISAGFGSSQYNLGYFGLSSFSFVDLIVSGELNYAFSESLSVSAGMQNMALLNDSLQNTVSGTEKRKLTGSLGLRIEF